MSKKRRISELEPSIKQWGVIAWNGRLNRVEDSEREVLDLIWEQLGE